MPRPKRRSAPEVAEPTIVKRPKTSSKTKLTPEEVKFNTNRCIAWFRK